ncbi:hypothetical protein ACOME3_004984 [Neoechinorhynchus agilis]
MKFRNTMWVIAAIVVPIDKTKMPATHKYDPMFTTRSANELVFGYFEPLLIYVNKLSDNASLFDPRVGLLKDLNGTHFGVFNVYTDGSPKNQEIQTYDGKDRIGIYTDRYCDMINGTDGTLFNIHPSIFGKTDNEVDVFCLDMCRSMKLSFKGTTNTQVGSYRIGTAS